MSEPTLEESLASEIQRLAESGEQYAHITKYGAERILATITELTSARDAFEQMYLKAAYPTTGED